MIPLKRLITWVQIKLLNKLPELTRQYDLIDPKIDEDSEVFSYYAKPVMQLGCRGARKATAVTPEGFLYTGAIETIFYTGSPLKKINKRIKTLYKGYLPLVQYDIEEDGILYEFKIFQYWLKDPLNSPLINFISIKVKNESDQNKNSSIALGMVKPSTDHRPDKNIDGVQLQQDVFSSWNFTIDENSIYCDDKLICLADETPNSKWKFENIPYDGAFKNKSRKKPCCIFQYDFQLASKKEKEFSFKVPHYPIPKQKHAFLEKLQNKTWNEACKEFEDDWETLLSKGLYIEIPEKKVLDTSRTSLMFNLMCQEFKEDRIIQKVNRFQYNKFWLRDSSFFSKMWGILGYGDVAHKVLLNFLEYQDESGNFLSQPGQLDGWGQSLWAFGEYVSLYKDVKFAEKVYPYIMRALEWLKIKLNKNKDGLMPSTNAFDNEFIMGKYTGHNFWVLHGLEGALHVLTILKKEDTRQEIQIMRDVFRNRLIKYLKLFSGDEKRIYPGLEFKNGIDWGNLLMIYPTPVLDPKDPLVIGTLNYYRKNKMQEGLSTWGPYLHHYVTERIAISELILNHQRRVLNDFYSMLLHTGSCNEGFEMMIMPWGNRDYEAWIGPIKINGNYPPHGWFACSFNTLLRNMLVREELDDLHLISTISPEWVKPNDRIVMKNAPTRFGLVNFEINASNDGLEMDFKADWREKPSKLLIHLPFFIKLKSLSINNKDTEVKDDKIITFDPVNFTLKLTWQEIPKININYELMVARYKRNYKTIYENSI